ncbi:MAG: uracil-DNA glycosylase [Treponema sp.]|nr:uracil-DNA glycosylase [Treponema sp.]
MSNINKNLVDFLNLTSDYISTGYKSNQPEDISIPVVSDDTIEKIAQEIKNCKNCPLVSKRINAAPGEGVLNPKVLVIGEGPGEDEDKQGRPFVGKAGQLLDKMLASIELSRTTNCFIANVIKCRPPFNRDPNPEETAACIHFLERQINILKPKFILIAGKVAAHTLLKNTDSISQMRGKINKLTFGDITYPTLVTYHPAALLRSEEYKRPAWEDLKLLRDQLAELN